MTNLLHFRREPVRAIRVIMVGYDAWVAIYSGDEWQEAWRTEIGTLGLVVDAAAAAHKRCGLPYIVHPAPEQTWSAA